MTPPSSSQDLVNAFAGTKCVIFDFDGVVADSEPASLSTLRDTLADVGLDMPIGQVRAQFLGKSLKTIEDYVADHISNEASLGFGEAWQSVLFAKFRDDLCPMPGLVDLLDVLDDRTLPYCVASSSSFERLGVALGALQLTDRFPNVFSAEQVKNGKPAPDLFLFAAAHMKRDPATCLVIEDSPHGIRAATAAGMQAVGFVGGSHLHGIEQDHTALLLEAGAADVVTDYFGLRELVVSRPPT